MQLANEMKTDQTPLGAAQEVTSLCEMEYLLPYLERRSQPSVIQALHMSISEPKGPKKGERCPQIAEMHMKGMSSVTPDACMFPYREER